jgi:hypothetical protein
MARDIKVVAWAGDDHIVASSLFWAQYWTTVLGPRQGPVEQFEIFIERTIPSNVRSGLVHVGLPAIAQLAEDFVVAGDDTGQVTSGGSEVLWLSSFGKFLTEILRTLYQKAKSTLGRGTPLGQRQSDDRAEHEIARSTPLRSDPSMFAPKRLPLRRSDGHLAWDGVVGMSFGYATADAGASSAARRFHRPVRPLQVVQTLFPLQVGHLMSLVIRPVFTAPLPPHVKQTPVLWHLSQVNAMIYLTCFVTLTLVVRGESVRSPLPRRPSGDRDSRGNHLGDAPFTRTWISAVPESSYRTLA